MRTLLENHDKDRNNNALEQRPVLQQAEILVEPEFQVVHEPRSMVLREARFGGFNLEPMLRLHLQVLDLHEFVVGSRRADFGNDGQTLVFSSSGHEPAGTRLLVWFRKS